jgi:hypothetical protein
LAVAALAIGAGCRGNVLAFVEIAEGRDANLCAHAPIFDPGQPLAVRGNGHLAEATAVMRTARNLPAPFVARWFCVSAPWLCVLACASMRRNQ